VGATCSPRDLFYLSLEPICSDGFINDQLILSLPSAALQLVFLSVLNNHTVFVYIWRSTEKPVSYGFAEFAEPK